MITKRKLFINFFYINIIIFFLPIFLLKVNAETKIIARNDDTLFKISKRYGIPLKQLMHNNNFNDANKKLEGEVIIITLNNDNDNDNDNDNIESFTYKVKGGDTLYKIARDYNLNVKDLISINNLENSSFIKPNQIIRLPNRAIYKQVVNEKDIKLESRKVFYHQTYKDEELSEISKIHNIPKEEIITLNKLNDSIKVNANTKLKIRKGNTLKWLKYGLLTIKWSDWRYLDGNYITEAKNKKNKPFYLAINCERRALNNTLNNSIWTSWYFPKSDFEFELIHDFCKQSFET